MWTAGIDLSTRKHKTAVAVINWQDDHARVTDLFRPADDSFMLHLAGLVAKVGIDSPLGWPDEYIAYLSAHSAGVVEVREGESGEEQRRRLAWRLTDQEVRRAGHAPLTVAADKISYVAMRAARLLSLLATNGMPVDRAGSGVVVEVYPAASLKRWGFNYRRYKGKDNQSARLDMICELERRLPWLDLDAGSRACRESDDALDAVIAGLTARAAALGHCVPPSVDQRAQASREGWIMLPTCEAEALLMPSLEP